MLFSIALDLIGRLLKLTNILLNGHPSETVVRGIIVICFGAVRMFLS